jgi:hypothetical protein
MDRISVERMILVLFENARQQLFMALLGVQPRQSPPAEAGIAVLPKGADHAGAPRHSEAATKRPAVVATALCRRAVRAATTQGSLATAKRLQHPLVEWNPNDFTLV